MVRPNAVRHSCHISLRHVTSQAVTPICDVRMRLRVTASTLRPVVRIPFCQANCAMRIMARVAPQPVPARHLTLARSQRCHMTASPLGVALRTCRITLRRRQLRWSPHTRSTIRRCVRASRTMAPFTRHTLLLHRRTQLAHVTGRTLGPLGPRTTHLRFPIPTCLLMTLTTRLTARKLLAQNPLIKEEKYYPYTPGLNPHEINLPAFPNAIRPNDSAERRR